MPARDLRNNNPGNIKKSADKWQGLADKQEDDAFFTFKAPEWGIRAMALILIKYQDDYGIKTLLGTKEKNYKDGLIGRWAPTTENNTMAYVSIVSRESGIGKNAVIDLHDYNCMKPIIKAMIHEESGVSAAVSEVDLDKGLALAGILGEKKPLVKSKTLAGASLAATSTMGTKIVDLAAPIADAQDKLSSFSDVDYIRYALMGLTFLGLAITVYAYLTDRQKRLT